MSIKRKPIVAGAIFLAILCLLPVTRDELEWCWTESQDQAADYLRYSSNWPKGLHAAEARRRYDERTWSDTKRAMISEAIKKNAAAAANPEVHKQRNERLERFFWTEVINENTLVCYKDYLLRYPKGEFAAQAREKINDLTLHPPDASAASDSPAP